MPIEDCCWDDDATAFRAAAVAVTCCCCANAFNIKAVRAASVDAPLTSLSLLKKFSLLIKVQSNYIYLWNSAVGFEFADDCCEDDCDCWCGLVPLFSSLKLTLCLSIYLKQKIEYLARIRILRFGSLFTFLSWKTDGWISITVDTFSAAGVVGVSAVVWRIAENWGYGSKWFGVECKFEETSVAPKCTLLLTKVKINALDA